MPRCIYSLDEFDAADGEHLLQNFLGARWTSNTIVCNELQAAFSDTIDSALEEGLRPIRNLFGTQGGRGETGPILQNLRASTGEILDFEPGFRPRLREPIVTSTELSDGRRQIRLQLGGQRQWGWALSILRNQAPALSVDENAFRSLASSVEGYIQGTVQLDVQIGGSEYFRGMLKACFNLLGVRYPDIAYEPCFNALRSFVRADIGTSRDFVR